MNKMGAKEFQYRIKTKVMQCDNNIKEEDLYFAQTTTSYYMTYKPKYPDSSNGDFIVRQNLIGEIFVYGNLNALVPTTRHFENIDDFEKNL